jgi:DNA polymerase-1
MVEFEFISGLSKIKDQNVFYLRSSPQILDFTNKDFCFTIEIFAQGLKVSTSVSRNNFKEIHSLLKQVLFLKDKKILCWNFKNYCSYYRNNTGRNFNSDCKILDLKVLGGLCGLSPKTPPESFVDAVNAFKNIKGDDYDRIYELYDKIHIPLMRKVIPKIETKGIVNKKNRRIEYCYYDVEGQENGRLSSSCQFDSCFLPLNLKKDDKENFKTMDEDYLFLNFDYKNMEVSVLEFLTKDSNLREVLESGDDFYESLYERLFSKICTPDKRSKIKKIFLPYVYGASPQALAANCDVSLSSVEGFIKNIRKMFSRTFDWLDDYSENSGSNVYTNLFGKKRVINEKYKSRNFIVQSTASIFCLDKLIDLSNYFKDPNILFYVHDSYLFSCDKKELDSTAEIIKNILLEDGRFFENIVINVSCEYGDNLNNLKKYTGVLT